MIQHKKGRTKPFKLRMACDQAYVLLRTSEQASFKEKPEIDCVVANRDIEFLIPSRKQRIVYNL